MQVVPEHMAAEVSAAETSLKVWEAWPGNHIFCCDGRCMVGPDVGVTAFAAALTTGASAGFWIFVGPSLALPYRLVGALLYVLTIGFMILTATTDPGIVPSNRSMDEAEADACANMQKSVTINGVTVPLKWCRTCRIFRPPRAAHCSECNVCVEKFDHHCPWMGQCIGRRNYRFFLGFVISVCALCAYTLVLSAYGAYRAVRLPPPNSRPAVGLPPDFISRVMFVAPVPTGLVVFTAVIMLCVAPLACYHCSLVCNNTTTAEEIKETYGEHNPFSRSTVENCHEACCSERGEPRVRMRAPFGKRLDTCQLISGDAGERGGERGGGDDGVDDDNGGASRGSIDGGGAEDVSNDDEGDERESRLERGRLSGPTGGGGGGGAIATHSSAGGGEPEAVVMAAAMVATAADGRTIELSPAELEAARLAMSPQARLAGLGLRTADCSGTPADLKAELRGANSV